MWDPLPRSDFDEIFHAFYDSRSDQVSAVEPHRLAVLFMVLSLGAHFDEQPAVSSMLSQDLYSNAWGALSLSNFTEAPSLETLTALHLMGLYLTSRKGGRYAESFYGLMGLAMRLAIAMGLHRDPGTWNLPQQMRERRRRIFWELHSFDVFRNLAFCRPPALLVRRLCLLEMVPWLTRRHSHRKDISTCNCRRHGIASRPRRSLRPFSEQRARSDRWLY